MRPPTNRETATRNLHRAILRALGDRPPQTTRQVAASVPWRFTRLCRRKSPTPANPTERAHIDQVLRGLRWLRAAGEVDSARSDDERGRPAMWWATPTEGAR